MNRRRFAAFALGFTASLVLPRSAFAMAFAKYDAANFPKLLGAGGALVVHVHADWCSVCRAQMPVMDRVLAEPAYKNVRAVRVNFDRDKQFLTDHKVVRQSTIIVFKGGKEVARLSYDADPAKIEQTLATALS